MNIKDIIHLIRSKIRLKITETFHTRFGRQLLVDADDPRETTLGELGAIHDSRRAQATAFAMKHLAFAKRRVEAGVVLLPDAADQRNVRHHQQSCGHEEQHSKNAQAYLCPELHPLNEKIQQIF